MSIPNVFVNSPTNNVVISKGSTEDNIFSTVTVGVASYPNNSVIISSNVSPTNDITLIRDNDPPESTNSIGTPGELRWDNNYLYLCVATNFWKKLSLSSIGGTSENINDVLAEIETINTSIDNLNSAVDNRVLSTDMRLNVTWPIRAVNVGGIITIKNTSLNLTANFFPSWPVGEQEGDLTVFGTADHANGSIAVDLSATISGILNDNPGWEYDSSSLEIALLDIDNRLVGWGTTSSTPNDGQTHGNGGHIITVSVGEFPEISDTNWVLSGDSSFSTLPSYAISSIKAPYKYINSTDLNTHTHTILQII